MNQRSAKVKVSVSNSSFLSRGMMIFKSGNYLIVKKKKGINVVNTQDDVVSRYDPIRGGGRGHRCRAKRDRSCDACMQAGASGCGGVGIRGGVRVGGRAGKGAATDSSHTGLYRKTEAA